MASNNAATEHGGISAAEGYHDIQYLTIRQYVRVRQRNYQTDQASPSTEGTCCPYHAFMLTTLAARCNKIPVNQKLIIIPAPTTWPWNAGKYNKFW